MYAKECYAGLKEVQKLTAATGAMLTAWSKAADIFAATYATFRSSNTSVWSESHTLTKENNVYSRLPA